MGRIYDSRRWKRLRLYQLAIEPLCRVCKRAAHHVDHITPISQGGDPWAGPFQSLCHEHHSIKTRAEAAGREWAGETGPDGLPVGGSHWWGSVSKPVDEPIKDEWHFE